ncbi:MAG: hypothetical protein HY301_20210 [Verrucomicrobia bacterium]|nr:hypothetical protein [Verrucomicrobiota bacterium]
MAEPFYFKPVERLFPFALRSGAVVVGRDSLRRQKRKLHFLLVTTDLAENSRHEFDRDFPGTNVVTRYTAEEIERHFHFKGTKVLGFKKAPITFAIYRELRDLVANESTEAPKPAETPPPPDAQAGTESDMSAV